MDQNLVEFIKAALEKNVSEEEIKQMLISQGWNLEQISAGIATAKTSNHSLIPPQAPQGSGSIHIGMWDTFQHILLFISLYIMATAISLMLNMYVDILLQPSNNFSASFNSTVFAGFASALLVSFPFFAFFFIETTRRRKKFPELEDLKSRKVLIYITLVGTFIIMLTNLIATVFQFLVGNISLNFIAHLTVNIAVPGVIFAYYLYQVKKPTVSSNA